MKQRYSEGLEILIELDFSSRSTSFKDLTEIEYSTENHDDRRFSTEDIHFI